MMNDEDHKGHWVFYDEGVWRDGGNYGELSGFSSVTYRLENVGNRIQLTGSDGSVSSVIMPVHRNIYETVSTNENTFAMTDYETGNYVEVYVNGMKLTSEDFTINGVNVILNKSLDVVGTIVEIMVFGGMEVKNG